MSLPFTELHTKATALREFPVHNSRYRSAEVSPNEVAGAISGYLEIALNRGSQNILPSLLSSPARVVTAAMATDHVLDSFRGGSTLVSFSFATLRFARVSAYTISTFYFYLLTTLSNIRLYSVFHCLTSICLNNSQCSTISQKHN